MTNELEPTNPPDELLNYEIRVKGHLGQQWADWFGEVTLTAEVNGNTLFSSARMDQAALYGLLKKVRDLGMPLLSVVGVEPDLSDAAEVKPQAGYCANDLLQSEPKEKTG